MAEMVLEEFEKKLKLLKVALFSCGLGTVWQSFLAVTNAFTTANDC